jgi:O-methyltransferase domain
MTKPPSSIHPDEQLVDLMRGYRVPQGIHVVVRLGIADLLEDGPKGVAELAQATGCHPQSLGRVLRALAVEGVFVEVAPHVFGHTEMSEFLRRSHPRSRCPAIEFLGAPNAQQPWAALEYSVRTGKPAFDHVYGMTKWEYGQRHPEEGALFDRMLAETRSDRWEALTRAWDFSRSKVVVDVGGGYGHVLVRILESVPSLRGILYDLPHVTSHVERLAHEAGVLDRCQIVGGSFFERVPAGDTYLLSDILHDWPDDESRAILAACRAGMAPDSRLLIMEALLVPCDTPRHVVMMDFTMLVEFGGGRQRTLQEHRELLAAADLEIERVEPTSHDMSVIIATPRS